MSVVIVGVGIGKPSAGVGVCHTRDGQVIEAVTVTARHPVAAAEAAVRTGLDLLADHGASERVLCAVEDVPPLARGGRQQQRAAAHRANVRLAHRDRAVTHGAVVEGIPVAQVRLVVGHPGHHGSTGNPPRYETPRLARPTWPRTGTAAACMGRGRKGPRGSQPGHALGLPRCPRGGPPGPPGRPAPAALTALDLVARPTGAPTLTPEHLAAWATAHGIREGANR